MKKVIILLLPLIIFNFCKKKVSPNAIPEHGTLLFSSGFENGVYIDNTAYPDNEDYRYIKGTDSETGSTWPICVLKSSKSAIHYVADDNHNAVFSEIQSVIGHDGQLTNALYQQENYRPDEDTQCPYEILDIKDGTKDLYIKYWIKLDSASLYKPDTWRTFFEWKTEKYAARRGFRLISFIYTGSDGIPYWHFQGDKNHKNSIWEIENKEIPVPVNEWFMTEFYWHWSEGDDGIVYWKINGQTIGEHHGPTTRRGKSIDFIMLSQIYGNSTPKHQWVDDIEIWDSEP